LNKIAFYFLKQASKKNCPKRCVDVEDEAEEGAGDQLVMSVGLQRLDSVHQQEKSHLLVEVGGKLKRRIILDHLSF
jgi:hypothetical protein